MLSSLRGCCCRRTAERHLFTYVYIHIYMCACVCRERERGGERGRIREEERQQAQLLQTPKEQWSSQWKAFSLPRAASPLGDVTRAILHKPQNRAPRDLTNIRIPKIMVSTATEGGLLRS